MNAITYADIPLLDEPGSKFVCPWGGAPGRGVFDCGAKAFSRLQAKLAASGGCADLVLTSEATKTSVTLKNIYLVKAEPVVTRKGDQSMQNVASWKLTLGDRRHVLGMKAISGRWNILKPAREKYFAETANGDESTPWTWTGIVGKLGTALGLNLSVIGTPAGNPSGLVWDADSPLEILGPLLAEIGQYLVYSPLTDVLTVKKINGATAGDVAALDALFPKHRLEGAATIRATRAQAPASVDVCFPIYDTALADERLDSDDRWHVVNEAAPAAVTTVAATKEALYYNHAYARRELVDGTPTIVNAAALETIAVDRAAEFYAQFQVEHADYELAGLHPLTPNALIRSVAWVSDPDGGRTFVRVGNPEADPRVTKGNRTYGTHGTYELQKQQPVEGTAAFVHRAGPRRLILPPRLEAERTGFFAVIQSQVGGTAEYKVRRVRKDLTYIGAQFSAWDLDGSTSRANDTKVLVHTDGEGKFVFLPFEFAVDFIRVTMVEDATGAGHPDEDTMVTGNSTGTPGMPYKIPPKAGEQQVLICKLKKASIIRLTSRLDLSLKGGGESFVKWHESACGTGANWFYYYWKVWAILEDVDPDTIDWDGWEALDKSPYSGGDVPEDIEFSPALDPLYVKPWTVIARIQDATCVAGVGSTAAGSVVYAFAIAGGWWDGSGYGGRLNAVEAQHAFQLTKSHLLP